MRIRFDELEKRAAAGAPTAQPRLAFVRTLAVAAPSGAQTVPTTRNDFALPGTQPLTITDPIPTPAQCTQCHSGYGQPLIEPWRNWQSSMMAQAGRDPIQRAAMAIANQDAGSAGETCIRCHMPKGWLEGRSVPEDATATTADDREGVQCAVCHRLVDPFNNAGAPAEDTAILSALSEPVTRLGGAQMVVDPLDRMRGPFNVVADLGSDPHLPDRSTLVSPYHKSSDLCGTCHNVLNPAYTRDMSGEYVPGPLDTPGDPALAFPEQQTYDEWALSEYASSGVYAPQFAGNDDPPIVVSCQDCHMPAVTGKDASIGPVRPNIPLHTMAGANTFTPKIIPLHPVFGAEVDPDILDYGIEQATRLLRLSATVEATLENGEFTVRVINETGHKLPTGYPDGRRMWLHVRAWDDNRQIVLESGRYVFSTGELVGYEAIPSDDDYDPYLHVWETHQGLSDSWATTLGMTAGPSFHLALNNKRITDNRIPPRGFNNAAFEAIDAEPLGATYADGQYWDDVVYPVGATAVKAEATLYYQTTTKEYIEFLKDENVTTFDGNILYDLWEQTDKAAPVAMARAVVDTETKNVEKCRKNVRKLQGKYLKSYLKAWQRCYALEAANFTCDDDAVLAELEAEAERVRERLGGVADKVCLAAELSPTTLGHQAYCPVPAADFLAYDFSDLAECAIAHVETMADSALSAAYGTAPPALPGSVSAPRRKCQAALDKASTSLATGWAKALDRCEAANASGKNNPPADCAADPDGGIAKASSKAAKQIAKCSDFVGLSGCATAGDAADVLACMQSELDEPVNGYVEVAFP